MIYVYVYIYIYIYIDCDRVHLVWHNLSTHLQHYARPIQQNKTDIRQYDSTLF